MILRWNTDVVLCFLLWLLWLFLIYDDINTIREIVFIFFLTTPVLLRTGEKYFIVEELSSLFPYTKTKDKTNLYNFILWLWCCFPLCCLGQITWILPLFPYYKFLFICFIASPERVSATLWRSHMDFKWLSNQWRPSHHPSMKVEDIILFSAQRELWSIWGSCEDGRLHWIALSCIIIIGTLREVEREDFCLHCCHGLVPFISSK